MKVCKSCGCESMHKIGFQNGKQRYKCKSCGHQQIDGVDDRVKYTAEEKNRAIVLYLEGCGFRRIARIMMQLFGKKYVYQTIIQWIKRAGIQALKQNENKKKIEVLEMDELYTFIKKKRIKSEYGLLLTGREGVLLHLK